MNEPIKGTSKFLSLVLRHKPETIGLQLDENGWANVDELITKCAATGRIYTPEDLDEIVATNDKKRFAYSEDKRRIRANQGHSIMVELNLPVTEPPEWLYHGTPEKFVAAIRAEGLRKMERQHVHLSGDRETAHKVGSRRGRPVILPVHSGQMHRDGYVFYLSDNGVWLTDHVPTDYID
ncbi:putative RNA 2'-phosphotransferase [Filimonas zeae]|uniref:Probable RNA 2'-phosphotransferase n=1 Tax=Filimonas zeae TaxID=1737353 RepID=A0A917ISI5_9BACT|nr:RNA 2'-phosphotransferase [Filimonas zeae]MDR6338187.1 putative RNA 2'-phosphotransferase [Filimonas zeae]GGH62145.1 putative RNA 2'-phosphotransferase [Filimonas zeae]